MLIIYLTGVYQGQRHSILSANTFYCLFLGQTTKNMTSARTHFQVCQELWWMTFKEENAIWVGVKNVVN